MDRHSYMAALDAATAAIAVKLALVEAAARAALFGQTRTWSLERAKGLQDALAILAQVRAHYELLDL